VLLEARADPGPKAHWGDTPLHWAARRGYTDVSQVLLSAGAAKDRGGTGWGLDDWFEDDTAQYIPIYCMNYIRD